MTYVTHRTETNGERFKRRPTVERFVAGTMTAPAGIWRKGDDLERPVRLPVPVYVIERGPERVLVDTGLHPAAAADASRHYDGAESLGFFELAQESSIADQIDLDTLTTVVLDSILGSAGDDNLDGGTQDDSIRGDAGRDTCTSGELRMSSCEVII